MHEDFGRPGRRSNVLYEITRRTFTNVAKSWASTTRLTLDVGAATTNGDGDQDIAWQRLRPGRIFRSTRRTFTNVTDRRMDGHPQRA